MNDLHRICHHGTSKLLAPTIVLLTVSLQPHSARSQTISPAGPAIDGLKEVISELKNILVKYDVFVNGSKVLTIEEASSPNKRWVKSTHFYNILYDNSSCPYYDPLLNWILWDEGRRTQFWVNTREAKITSRPAVLLQFPLFEGYFGHLGLLTPDQRLGSGDMPLDFDASSYYLPAAFDLAGWRIPSREQGCDVLMRTGRFGSDRIYIHPKKFHFIKRRIILDENKVVRMRFDYDNFVMVTDKCWLPTSIRFVPNLIDEDPTFYKVRYITTDDSEVATVFQRQFPPGTLVEDHISGTSYAVPGGEELIDYTLSRIHFLLAGTPGGHRVGIGLASGMHYLIAAASFLILLTILCRTLARVAKTS